MKQGGEMMFRGWEKSSTKSGPEMIRCRGGGETRRESAWQSILSHVFMKSEMARYTGEDE